MSNDDELTKPEVDELKRRLLEEMSKLTPARREMLARFNYLYHDYLDKMRNQSHPTVEAAILNGSRLVVALLTMCPGAKPGDVTVVLDAACRILGTGHRNFLHVSGGRPEKN